MVIPSPQNPNTLHFTNSRCCINSTSHSQPMVMLITSVTKPSAPTTWVAPGLYPVQVKTADGRVEMKRVVKE
jgi:hypothetical protein